MEKKKVLGLFGALALTAAIAATGTLALLNNVTETKTNVFSSSKNVDTTLTEEAGWESGWTDYLPGEAKAKNPVLTNTSTDTSVYVAMRLSFVGNDGNRVSQDEFKKYATLESFNTENKWEQVKTYDDGSALYMLKNPLAPNSKSDKLFGDVSVNAGITGSVSNKYISSTIYADASKTQIIDKTDTLLSTNTVYYDENGNVIKDVVALPTFEIEVKGFAVQAGGNVTYETAKTELTGLSDKNINVK